MECHELLTLKRKVSQGRSQDLTGECLIFFPDLEINALRLMGTRRIFFLDGANPEKLENLCDKTAPPPPKGKKGPPHREKATTWRKSCKKPPPPPPNSKKNLIFQVASAYSCPPPPSCGYLCLDSLIIIFKLIHPQILTYAHASIFCQILLY